MAWPEALVALLAQSDSQASQALRWGLHGLRASLQAVLEEVPQDPGGEQLRTLLAEVDPLLNQGPVLPPEDSRSGEPSRTGAASRAAPPVRSPGLQPLARAVAQDERLRTELKQSPLTDDSDEAIWGAVQRLFLRLPAHLADEWRQRSQDLAEQAGARLDEWAAAVLPLPWDEAIYPGVTGDIRAAGLRSAPTAPLDPRVLPSHDPELHLLASVVSTSLWFLEHDPHLHHCLKSVFRFGVSPLTGEQRERYTAELLRLWERVRTNPTDSSRPHLKDRLKALLDLDEALHSLVYPPPAAPDSWWGRLRGQAREALFRARDRAVQAGCAVHLQVLSGNFADINRLAPDSLQVDFGVAGEVAACLRVWARIDGEEFKGRVLFRSPQEDV
jgi:hypothetical protein